MLPKLLVRNIKVSLFITKSLFINQKIKIIQFPKQNLGSIKITIYQHSPKLLNITGLNSFKSLKIIKQFIKNIYSCKIRKCRIDSIMLNYKAAVHKRINLNKLATICKDIPDYILDFTPEIFNAPFLKSKSQRGTMLLFSTGSVQIMGCKDRRYIKTNQELVNRIFTKYENDYVKLKSNIHQKSHKRKFQPNSETVRRSCRIKKIKTNT